MQFDQQNTYDLFWNTGKVCDYLTYIRHTRQVENATGENIAYHDRWDCPAGTAGR